MILDTNALSAFADGDESLHKLLLQAPRLHLPVIVLGEYRYGLKRSRERSRRERWLDEMESICETIDVGSTTARHYAQIREELRLSGKPIPENDIWIAALAREHALDVITRNAHFDAVEGLNRRSW